MDSKQDGDASDKVLAQLLTDAKFQFSINEDGYQVALPGKLRPWDLRLRASGGWLSIRAYVVAYPTSKPVRLKILEAIARLNGSLAMAKFCIGWDAVVLDIEDRLEHMSAERLYELIHYYINVAERYYPQLVDVLRERTDLVALEQAYRRTGS